MKLSQNLHLAYLQLLMNTSVKYQANWTETVGGVVRTRFCRQTDCPTARQADSSISAKLRLRGYKNQQGDQLNMAWMLAFLHERTKNVMVCNIFFFSNNISKVSSHKWWKGELFCIRLIRQNFHVYHIFFFYKFYSVRILNSSLHNP